MIVDCKYGTIICKTDDWSIVTYKYYFLLSIVSIHATFTKYITLLT